MFRSRLVCSHERNLPPGKPGAFAKCHSECQHLKNRFALVRAVAQLGDHGGTKPKLRGAAGLKPSHYACVTIAQALDARVGVQ